VLRGRILSIDTRRGCMANATDITGTGSTVKLVAFPKLIGATVARTNLLSVLKIDETIGLGKIKYRKE
jgi:hypothetical protein